MVFLVWLSVPVPNGKRRKFNDIARGTERNWKKDAWLDLATRRSFDRMSERRLLKGLKMTKDEENELRKAFTFENFKKLLYFVNCCAGEGLQLGKVCADELLYRDILAEVSEDVLETIEKETNTFLGIDDN